jgi:uncharacterized protein (TIGR02594 family)
MFCPDALRVTPFSLAQRFVGMKEVPGRIANPAILGMLQLDGAAVSDDQTPWCSAFANYIMWLLRQPRTKSLRARSWLEIGTPVEIEDTEPGFDIAIFMRGDSDAGPDVIEAPGHVAFVAGKALGGFLPVLGGNQGDAVTVKQYPVERLLGIRRVYA